jgi:hypothetical protein
MSEAIISGKIVRHIRRIIALLAACTLMMAVTMGVIADAAYADDNTDDLICTVALGSGCLLFGSSGGGFPALACGAIVTYACDHNEEGPSTAAPPPEDRYWDRHH